jgi:hypothetical protein
MNLIAISGMLVSATLLNKYRHKMLGTALVNRGYSPVEGMGYANGVKEDLWVLILENPSAIADMMDEMRIIADCFDQDYIYVVDNDFASLYDCRTKEWVNLGTFWKAVPGTPTPVMQKVSDGLRKVDGGAYLYFKGEYHAPMSDHEVWEYAKKINNC